ncbi:LrgB family protein, partial [Salmonella enterica]|uniref:LrgB family protein n=1 Tax=Salmonella enterica TaxID=28901 RepID=UPI00398C7B41
PSDRAAPALPNRVARPFGLAWRLWFVCFPGIEAVCVIFVCLVGRVLGRPLFNAMHIRTQAARGLALGTASHALGTARCADLDYQEGAFSSLALVIRGIITSLVALFLFPLILALIP